MWYIYKIDCLANGKVYVGQTNYPERRWSQHKYSALNEIDKKNTQLIARAIAKHGIDNFRFEVIATCKTQEDVNFVEELIIQQYDSRNMTRGYNVDVGGRISPRTPEVTKKISSSLKKYYKIFGHNWVGKNHTEKSKQKMSEAAMGKPGTNNGKTFDDEWVLGMSKSQIGMEKKGLRRFSDEDELEICRLHTEQKLSGYKLARIFGCHRSLIYEIIQRNGFEVNKSSYTGHSNGCNKFTKEEELEICSLFATNKFTVRGLARKFNCGNTTMRDILIRGGVYTKNNKEDKGN